MSNIIHPDVNQDDAQAIVEYGEMLCALLAGRVVCRMIDHAREIQYRGRMDRCC